MISDEVWSWWNDLRLGRLSLPHLNMFIYQVKAMKHGKTYISICDHCSCTHPLRHRWFIDYCTFVFAINLLCDVQYFWPYACLADPFTMLLSINHFLAENHSWILRKVDYLCYSGIGGWVACRCCPYSPFAHVFKKTEYSSQNDSVLLNPNSRGTQSGFATTQWITCARDLGEQI